MSAEDHATRLVLRFDRMPPGLRDLVGVARPEHGQAGDRPQPDQLLDRLVGWAVFSDSDGIVSKHEDHTLAHQRGHA